MVSVKHGVNEVSVDNLTGRTVNCARGEVQGLLNIATDTPAVVNGSRVNGDYVIRDGDRVEFVKAAGTKGAEETENDSTL